MLVSTSLMLQHMTRMLGPSCRRPLRLRSRWSSSSSSSSSLSRDDANNNNNNNNNNNSSNDMQDVRHKLLLSALHQVHEHGWTQDAIAAAVASDSDSDSTVSISIAGMIQPEELVAFSMDHWNARLAVDLSSRQEIWRCESLDLNLDDTTTPALQSSPALQSQRIEEAIKTRLGYLLPHLRSQRWHEGMAMGVRDPAAALHTKEQLRQLVQIIARAVVVVVDADDDDAADVHADNNNNNNKSIPLSDWQQLALGGVYVATELHLLTDQSPDYQDTWEFLHERVSEWERLFVTTKQQQQQQPRDHNSAPSSVSFLNRIVMMNPTALLQQGGNVAYTASAVASSLAGGAVSLIQPNGMFSKAASALNSNSGSSSSGVGSSSGVPEFMWNALLKVPQPPPPFGGGGAAAAAAAAASPAAPTASSDGTGSTGASAGTSMDGTDPSHYDVKPVTKK